MTQEDLLSFLFPWDCQLEWISGAVRAHLITRGAHETLSDHGRVKPQSIVRLVMVARGKATWQFGKLSVWEGLLRAVILLPCLSYEACNAPKL